MDLQSDGAVSFSEMTSKGFHLEMDIVDILRMRRNFVIVIILGLM